MKVVMKIPRKKFDSRNQYMHFLDAIFSEILPYRIFGKENSEFSLNEGRKTESNYYLNAVS